MTLSVGSKAPDFTLPSSNGDVTLSSLLSRAPVVLYFYPKDDTPGCTVEACSFRDNYGAFNDAGAQVIGISSDSVESHQRFASKHQLPMTLVSDQEGKVRALYGVRPTLGIMPGRATFVIDMKGIVRHVFVSQLRFQRHVDESLDVVRSLAKEAGGDVGGAPPGVDGVGKPNASLS